MPLRAAGHGATTPMLGVGVGPGVASGRLGDATVAMTIDRYFDLPHSLGRDAAQAVQSFSEGASEDERASSLPAGPQSGPADLVNRYRREPVGKGGFASKLFVRVRR